MEFEQLRQRAYAANMLLPRYGLVTFAWGNASEADRDAGVFAIKPSGILYEDLTPADMVVLDFSGRIISGHLKPSSDTRTHLVLYRSFPDIGGVVHTHSTFAAGWAQACMDIPCCGTTHADCFYGPVPCTRLLTTDEIEADYEGSTGRSIVEAFVSRGLSPVSVPGVLCASHGPFTWGRDAAEAAYHAAVLEEAARMAILTKQICGEAVSAPQRYIDKHFLRKHGPDASYGQSGNIGQKGADD